jgi:hypothetical protein
MRLIGKEVEVFLKIGQEVIYGILFDIEEEYVYIQSSTGPLITIPKENIKYYTSKSNQEPAQGDIRLYESEPIDSDLSVYIDRELITRIPVPPTFDLSSYNDNIMKVILGNPDVAVALVGRVQRSMEYFPGKVYITTDAEGDMSEPETVMPPSPSPSDNSFAMTGAGGMISSYLQPSQMIGRLSKAAKLQSEEKKDE